MRYEQDVLAAARRPRTPPPEVPARAGLVVTDALSGFTGAVVGLEAGAVLLRDSAGRERGFSLRSGTFRVDGRAVALVKPRPAAPRAPLRTASGSVAAAPAPARVAQPSRIYVEGVHDAALVEKVWGDDLREEGIAVEYLEGVDDLPAVVERFAPGPGRRLGVLVDHLVPGSKEARLAAAVGHHRHVLVTGHPYVDVWQAVRPAVLGIAAWPEVPRGTPWKDGVCARLDLGDPPAAWRRILGSVRTYADLEPGLVGAVEQLLDFILEDGGQR